MKNKVEFKETVELFVLGTIKELIAENETPRINFVFKNEAYELFYEVMKHPHKIKNFWTPNIKKEDIEKLKNMNNGDYLTIYVKDHIKFFQYLTDITNTLNQLYLKYKTERSARGLLIQIMRRIWLRMGVNDVNNVESFLHRELEFIKNNLFDDYINETEIERFNGHNVTSKNNLNRTWDESNKSISFKIYTEDGYHSLPKILYDVIADTCYIYAIQNDFEPQKLPDIEKLIYKLYKGKGQPNKVYALKLFVKMLKEKGINNIKVPTLQVLSYRYHELLSKQEQERFLLKWNDVDLEKLQYSDTYSFKEYTTEKIWYDHVVDKEDLISKNKTENLINLVYRIISEDDELILTNDIDVDDTLNIKVKNKKRN